GETGGILTRVNLTHFDVSGVGNVGALVGTVSGGLVERVQARGLEVSGPGDNLGGRLGVNSGARRRSLAARDGPPGGGTTGRATAGWIATCRSLAVREWAVLWGRALAPSMASRPMGQSLIPMRILWRTVGLAGSWACKNRRRFRTQRPTSP